MDAEPQPVARKEKFEKDKAIASFKEKMGMGLSSIKQQLLRAKAGQNWVLMVFLTSSHIDAISACYIACFYNHICWVVMMTQTEVPLSLPLLK